MRTYAVLSDIQIPFQDKPVLDLVLRFLRDIKPDGVVLAGDVADCYSISDHRKSLRTLLKATLQHEIDQCHTLMESLEFIKERHWLGGNHEQRLYKHICDKAPALGLIDGLDFPTIFGLGEHNFKWRPYGEYIKLGKLLVTHGDIVRKHSAYSARAHWDKYGVSVLHGHTHRLGSYFHTNASGPNAAWENGCLCKLDGLGYTHYPNWQQGFSIVHVGDRGFFSVTQVPVLERRILFYGGRTWSR